MMSTLIPVSVPRDTRVSTVTEVLVSQLVRECLVCQTGLLRMRNILQLLRNVALILFNILYKIYFWGDIMTICLPAPAQKNDNKFLIFIFEDIDECVSAPCQNGGSCIDQVNGYLCQCAPGYTDLQCQTGKFRASSKLVIMTAMNKYTGVHDEY